jgi:flagellar biosynthesis/type III secretory pathway M-ring protein FliF/YscJ
MGCVHSLPGKGGGPAAAETGSDRRWNSGTALDALSQTRRIPRPIVPRNSTQAESKLLRRFLRQLNKPRRSNYEFSKAVRHIVNPVGKVEKLSVAVVIDNQTKVFNARGGNAADGSRTT